MLQAPELMGVMMSNFFWLTDEQMGRLWPFSPKSHGSLGSMTCVFRVE